MITPISPEALNEAAGIIANGGLVVFPTDTVYGIGCNPYNTEAIEAIYRAKGRDTQKALPILLASSEDLGRFAHDLTPEADLLARLFWPGALTLVLKRAAELPEALGAGETLALRIPDHRQARELIELCGGAIATTSANISGLPDAFTAEQAEAYLGDHVALILDGGRTLGSIPSTVVDCTLSPPRVLRAGALAGQIGTRLDRLRSIQKLEG